MKSYIKVDKSRKIKFFAFFFSLLFFLYVFSYWADFKRGIQGTIPIVVSEIQK